MKRAGWLGSMVLILLISFGDPVFAQLPDYYLQGEHYRSQGQWENALKIWWQGKQELAKIKRVDPRIGVAFIETATANEAKTYYEPASELYLWGFSDSTAFAYPDVVVEEAQRVLPLVAAEEKEEWQSYIEKRDPRLITLIRGFWLLHDFRPSTPVNERLIEHWERIALARKHFTKNKESVYGTDDRGVIYVRYGEPDRAQHGYFGQSILAKTEMKDWTKEKFFLDDPSPEYEVWAYDSLGTEEPVIFLFSYRYARGHYGLQPGVDYVVPQFMGANKLEYRAYYLLRYYAELLLFDELFASRLAQLRNLFEAMDRQVRHGGSPTLAKSYHNMIAQISESNKAEDRLNPRERFAPKERSEYVRKFKPIEIKRTTFRYLENGQTPQLAVIAALYPELRGAFLDRKQGTIVVPRYQLFNKLYVRDEDYREVMEKSRLLHGPDETIAVFSFPHLPDMKYVTLAAEAYADTLLLAIGKEDFRAAEPLSLSSGQLEMSDLLLGVLLPEGDRFPYPVFPIHDFARQDPVHIYFEIYHLRPNDEGKYQYELEIGTVGLKEGRKIEDKNQLSFRYQLESDTPNRREQYGLDVAKLKPGDYDLFVRILDRNSGQRLERRVGFSITKD